MTKREDDHQYGALIGAAAATRVLARLFGLFGILAFVLCMVGLMPSMGRLSSLEAVIILGGMTLVSLAILFAGWRLEISAELMQLQIDLAEDMARVAEVAEEVRGDARDTIGKLDLLLRTIAASSARTAAAVETLVNTVRRPPDAP